MYHLASKTIFRTSPTRRRSDTKRKRRTTIIKSIPPRIRAAEQMPTPHRLPISLRVRRPRHRRRRSETPARRPPRLRHPDGLRVRDRRDPGREVGEAGRGPARVEGVDVGADPVDLGNHRLPVALLPDVGRVHVPERPVHARGAHGGACLADVGEDIGRAGALPIQVFAADRDADDEAVELRVLFHGGRQCFELIRNYRRAP